MLVPNAEKDNATVAALAAGAGCIGCLQCFATKQAGVVVIIRYADMLLLTQTMKTCRFPEFW